MPSLGQRGINARVEVFYEGGTIEMRGGGGEEF